MPPPLPVPNVAIAWVVELLLVPVLIRVNYTPFLYHYFKYSSTTSYYTLFTRSIYDRTGGRLLVALPGNYLRMLDVIFLSWRAPPPV